MILSILLSGKVPLRQEDLFSVCPGAGSSSCDLPALPPHPVPENAADVSSTPPPPPPSPPPPPLARMNPMAVASPLAQLVATCARE